MGLLEDIGRAGNLSSSVARLTDTAVNIRDMQRKRAVENAEAQRKSAIDAKTMQKLNNELKIQERESQRYNRLVDVRTVPMFSALSPGTQQKVLDDMVKTGVVDADTFTGKVGHLTDYVKDIEASSEKFREFMLPEVQAKQQAYFAVENQLKQMAPDDKKRSEVEAQLNSLRQAYNASLNAYQQNYETIKSKEGEKMVERTVDLGDKVEYIYTDGTRETKPKGKLASPGEQKDSLMQAQRSISGNINQILKKYGDNEIDPLVYINMSKEERAKYREEMSGDALSKITNAGDRQRLSNLYRRLDAVSDRIFETTGVQVEEPRYPEGWNEGRVGEYEKWAKLARPANPDANEEELIAYFEENY